MASYASISSIPMVISPSSKSKGSIGYLVLSILPFYLTSIRFFCSYCCTNTYWGFFFLFSPTAEIDNLGLGDLGFVVGKFVGTGWDRSCCVAFNVSKNISHCQSGKFSNICCEVFSQSPFQSSLDMQQLSW